MQYLAENILGTMRFARTLFRPRSWSNKLKLSRLVKKDIRASNIFYKLSLKARSNSKTVIFSDFLPSVYVLKIEGLFARALQLKGYKTMALCDQRFAFIDEYNRKLFRNKTISIPSYIPWSQAPKIKKLIEGVIRKDYPSIKKFQYKGSLVGISSLASLPGGFTVEEFEKNPRYRNAVKKLMLKSCLYTEACKKIINKYRPELVMGVEKGSIGCSEIFYQAVEAGIDFVQWVSCHEPNSIMMNRYTKENERIHPISVSKKSWAWICQKPWDEKYRSMVMQKFEKGYSGKEWFKYRFLSDSVSSYERGQIVKKYNLDPAKKTAVIFSHVLNDANLFYGDDIFPSGFTQWLLETVRAARENKNVNWILKLHPSNVYRRATAGHTGEYAEISLLKNHFGFIPEELRIIYPADTINPLSLFKNLDYAITVRGTIGIEVPCFGKVVLTAGTGRYSGFGFTEDSTTADEYIQKIKHIHNLKPPTEEQVRLALRYAYLLFILRPAKYDSFAGDVYQNKPGHAFYRNLSFRVGHFSQLKDNAQFKSILDWITDSREENFLSL